MKHPFFMKMILLFFLFLGVQKGYAQEEVKKLQNIRQELKIIQEEQSKIHQKVSQTQEDLNILQKKLIVAGKDISQVLNIINVNKKDLIVSRQQEQTLRQELFDSQKQSSQLITTIHKITLTPNYVVLLQPGNLTHNIRQAKLLKNINEQLRLYSLGINQKIQKIQIVQDKIKEDQHKYQLFSKKLIQQQQNLTQLIEKKSQISRQLQQQDHAYSRKITLLAKQAQTIQDFIVTLRVERQKQLEKKANAQKAANKAPIKLASLSSKSNKGVLPVKGKIVQQFGVRTNGLISRGIYVETTATAQVFAPADGIIVFSGPFRDYGNIIIIEHSNEYHSLIAGAQTIYVSTGDHILKREPIAQMGKEIVHPKLYIELRQKGKVLNPLFLLT